MSVIRASATDHTAANQLFDQWLEHWQEEPHPVPRFARAEPAAAAAPPTQEAGSSPLPASPAAAAPLLLFSPRAGLRPLLTVATVLCGAATGLWVLVAIVFPTNSTLGAAAVLAALTGALWQARMRARGTLVTIEDGVLKVVRGESRHQFPLTGVHPPIDIVGEPGHRAWKVLIQRRGMAPYVVDDRMVDPYEFTDAIRRFRPRA